MPAARPEKNEAIKLRKEQRMGSNAIARLLGVSRGSISNWLKDFPLTPEEQRKIPGGRGPLRGKKREAQSIKTESPASQMVGNRLLTKQQKGKIAEAAVMFRLVLQGFNVFGSLFDGDKIDWLVEDPETRRISRIQVRWARPEPRGYPVISLRFGEGRGKSRPPTKEDFDVIVGYDLYTDTCYVWTWNDVCQLTSCATIHPDFAEKWDKLRGSSVVG